MKTQNRSKWLAKNEQALEICQASRQIEAEHYIRHKDMKAWLLSWGTDRELLPPKCICGRNHRQSFMSSDGSRKR